MKTIFILVLLCISAGLTAQQSNLTGAVINEKGAPLPYATVVLLLPGDSTLSNYSITNNSGSFDIRNIKPGSYILQASFMGFVTFHHNLNVPLPGGSTSLGAIVMKARSVELGAVDITAEHIPMIIKKDTVEYNAAAFKTRTDAVAEDILKKLPGVEVDRSGNIKAQGEDVDQVLVNGQEFFSNDPKVATRNLPAEAVDKIQVYNKKSEETELTGIDDGTYDKTINMILKSGRNSAWFGDVSGGGGTGDHYQAGARVFRFTRQNQFAMLGMANNINKFGFTFSDFMDFNGGLGAMMSGSGAMKITMGDDGSLPIDFGQTISGLVNSGAAGINYTHQFRKQNRVNVSYMGSGTDKKLTEKTFSRNFTATSSFNQYSDLNQHSDQQSHRVNLLWRDRLDSTQNMILSGSVSLNSGSSPSTRLISSYFENNLQNELNSINKENYDGISSNGSGSYIKKMGGSWKVFQLSGDVSINQSIGKSEWNNLTRYFYPDSLLRDNQYRDEKNSLTRFTVSTSSMFRLSGPYYIEPQVEAGAEIENSERKQGLLLSESQAIDSLSPVISRNDRYIQPSIAFRRNTENSQLSIRGAVETVELLNDLNNAGTRKRQVTAFLPAVTWELDMKQGKRLHLFYETRLIYPTVSVLLPVADYSNSLQVITGSRELKPEYRHHVCLNWMFFDQFSSTSIFTGLTGNYTLDKISWSKEVMPDLRQSLTRINVPEDYQASFYVDFSTPVRRFGLTFHAGINEGWNKGISLVNHLQNINNTFNHTFSLSLENRKKDHWDVSAGGSVQLSDARYSLRGSMNKTYLNLGYYADINYTPTKRWNFAIKADITRYDARSFNNAVDIPLIRAEISHYFLADNRASIALEGADLLNKNTGIERISELNYLMERTSNIISRYIMISLKYKLNKFGGDGNQLQVKMKNR
ncbi:MAG: TonB-dependent receptor [Bacteroidetes bacterium]|nr:TonB-dependent receptor [Bacteroidota bacterium]